MKKITKKLSCSLSVLFSTLTWRTKRSLFVLLLLVTGHWLLVSAVYAAEFEVVDKLLVNGRSIFKSSVTVYGLDALSQILGLADESGNYKVVVTTTGNVGIGTTGPLYQLQLSLDSAAKPTSNTWTIASDIRVKKDVRPFTDGLEVIKKLNPISYKLNGKAGLPKDKEGISIIANDVQDIVPYCISKYKAKLEQSDTKETELYDFNSGALTFVLINAVKEQQNEIASITLAMTKQEKEIEELKAEIKKLKN